MQKQKNEKDQQIEELTYKWKRALADYQNLEKRIGKAQTEAVKYAARRVIEKILPAVDSLENAEKHLKNEGLSLAVKSLKDALSGEGIKKIEVIGKKFNPHEMECVEIVLSDKDDVVIEEVSPGYMLEDKVLRVAKVKVSKLKNKEV